MVIGDNMGPPGNEKTKGSPGKPFLANLFFSFPGGLVLCPITIGTGTPGKEKKRPRPLFLFGSGL